MMHRSFLRGTYLIFGLTSLLIGIVGIFVPLLPTTPFLILAAICFNQGSPRFHSWLLHHRIFGPPVRDWNQRHAIKLKYKILASVMMSSSLVYLWFQDGIPVIGKASVTTVLSLLAAFIWTRKS